ncbi:MAG TPA: hypothetical protein DCM05_10790 [Elusimicrobia bacterium]|nr:hypothetical protein [Elusimicrobiota bacterium]
MKAVLVDAGPIVALLDRSDRHHEACRKALADIRAPLATVWPAVTEAAYLLSSVSPRAQTPLFEMLESGALELLPLGAADIPRMRELMEKYRDLPMDLADAALVRAAEREGLTSVLTTDQRDFSLYRPTHTRAFHLLPKR